MFRLLRLSQIAVALILAGCTSLNPLRPSPTPDSTRQAIPTPQTNPTPTTIPSTDQRILRIWLPPRFDPEAGTPAAALFKQRLEEFASDHPRIQIDLRIKSDEKMIETLSNSIEAAPEVLPDLIALSSSDMQVAAAAGYLHPLEGLTDILQDPDWYAFARDMGHIKNTEFGIPFAADAILIVYRQSVFTEIPETWEDIISSGNQMAFAVSDDRAVFPIVLYLSANGELSVEPVHPALDEEALTQVLLFYQNSLNAGSFPLAIRDFKTDLDVLDFFRNGDADVAVIRATSDIQTQSGEYLPLPGLADVPFSPVDGWVWALAGRDADKQEIAVELASFLTDSEFMSAWTLAAGYLPTRPQALDGWDDEELKTSINDVLQSAVVLPSEERLQAVGPAVRQALVLVFNGEQAEKAARGAVESLE